MKSIQQIREAYNTATNLSESEDRKLSSLVELGLLDAKKLPTLKESLNKPVEQMSGPEKRMILNLLESVLSEMQSKSIKDYYATPDPRVQRAGYPSQKEAPSVLLLKRKAIRVFPDGQKVALYYAQSIDKYVSIPYNEIGINEQTVPPSARGPEETPSSNNTSRSTSSPSPERKFSEPMRAGGSKLSVGAPGPQDVRIRTGVDATIERLNRKAQAAMAKDVRESFHNKLENLKEDDFSLLDLEYLRRGMQPPGGGFPSYGAGEKIGSGAKVKTLGSRYDNLAVKQKPQTRPSGPPTRNPVKLPPSRRKKETGPSPRDPGRYYPQTKPQTRPSGPPTRKPVEKPVKKPDEKPVEKPVVQPKPQKPVTSPNREAKPIELPVRRVEPPKVEPTKPEFKPTTPFQEPAKQPAKEPAVQPKPGKKPDVLPTQEPISKPADKTKSDKETVVIPRVKQQEQPAAKAQEKKKPDEKGTGRREPKEGKNKRRYGLPGIALTAPPKKPLQPMTSSLKLAVMAPTGKSYTALDAADSIRARKAMIAQASMQESVDLDGNLFELNTKTARKVKSLYESLNKKNKKKMIEMMNESDESLQKIISFAARQ